MAGGLCSAARRAAKREGAAAGRGHTGKSRIEKVPSEYKNMKKISFPGRS